MSYIELSLDTLTIKTSTYHNAKFYADAFVYEDDNFYILTNGVNLILDDLDSTVNAEHIIKRYNEQGDCFFKDFRGSFSGVFIDKKEHKCLVYTNHTGDQKLFYSVLNNSIIISSDIFKISENISTRSLDINAAYEILTYGYISKNKTLVENITRLTAGTYLLIEKSHIEVKEYYTIDNTPNHNLSEDECIENIDKLFRNAVDLEYRKDKQYKLRHLASMSGGLDCRMTNWVANDLGYTDTVNLTYSQYGYLEMEIAQKVSTHLSNEWMFFGLDSGNYLKEIDEITKKINAQTSYATSSQSHNALKLINFNELGILHTGQLGDVIIGTYSPNSAYDPPQNVKAISRKLIHKTKTPLLDYKNNEIANIEMRGFNGILSDNFGYQQYTESTSPFLDVDFLNFCLSIPIEKRAHHNIYKKWIMSKYPEADTFKWESINARLSAPSMVIRNKLVPFRKIPNFCFQSLLFHAGIPQNKNSKYAMSPYDYWYRSNPSIKIKFMHYFKKHIDLLNNPELRKDCEFLFDTGACAEKIQVLTLLSAIKQLKIQA